MYSKGVFTSPQEWLLYSLYVKMQNLLFGSGCPIFSPT